MLSNGSRSVSATYPVGTDPVGIVEWRGGVWVASTWGGGRWKLPVSDIVAGCGLGLVIGGALYALVASEVEVEGDG